MGENNFYYIFYLNISKISFQHVINIKLLMSYFLAFHSKSSRPQLHFILTACLGSDFSDSLGARGYNVDANSYIYNY